MIKVIKENSSLYLKQNLSLLETTIEKIFKCEKIDRKFYMETNAIIYSYCTGGDTNGAIKKLACNSENLKIITDYYSKRTLIGKELYICLVKFISSYLTTIMKECEAKSDLLEFYIKKWDQYCFSSKILNGICDYFNHNFIKYEMESDKEVYYIYQLAMLRWYKTVFEQNKHHVMEAIIKEIENERNGTLINSSMISRALNSYIMLGEYTVDFVSQAERNLYLYQENFEDAFIEETDKFYARESAEFLRYNSVTEYVKLVEKRLNEEKKRIELYLHTSTTQRLIKTCENVLIEKHLEMFAQTFQNLLDSDKIIDLRRMYQLVSRIKEGREELKTVFERHVCEQGKTAIAKCADVAAKDPRIYIQTIVEVHKKYTDLVFKLFGNDRDFVIILNKACGEFINCGENKNKSPELLAKYCDLLLSKSSKNPGEAELEDELNQAMKVFKHIEDKDVFMRFYRNLFAKRIILRKSTSDNAEELMMSELNHSCGFSYTNQLKEMLKDIGVSENLNEKLRDHLKQTNVSNGIDFSIQVLRSGIWPYSKNLNFSLPFELERSVQIFNNFYDGLHSGRKLTWFYNLSKGELITNCFKSRYTLKVTTFQMALLLQFNEQTSLTVQQLSDNTGINYDIVIQLLLHLFKIKLLSCTEEENLNKDSLVELFLEYRNKNLRVNIAVPLKTELKVEQKVIYTNIEGDRKTLINSAIVRIMKMRGILTHTELVGEVLRQLSCRFKPKPSLIKKSIEYLIEKEYLKRMDDRNDIYSYVA